MAATGNHDAKLLQMQLEALGGDRREHIVTTRFKEEEHLIPVPPPRSLVVRNLSSSDADAGGQKAKLDAWYTAWEYLKEDVKHERHLAAIGTGIGQSHRHKLQPTLATGPAQRGENVSGRSLQSRRARAAPIKAEVIRIGGRKAEVPSRGGPHDAASSVRARGRDASLLVKLPAPTKSSKSQKVNEAPRISKAVDPFQRRERRSHTQVVDLCKPSDFLAFSAFASTNKEKTALKEAKAPARPRSQAPQPTSSLPAPTTSAKGPDVAAPGSTHAPESTVGASSAHKATHKSTVNPNAVNYPHQANVSRITVSPPVDKLPASVKNPSEPELERSFTREGLLRFLPRLREQLPKELFAQVEAFVHTGEEDDQPGEEDDQPGEEDDQPGEEDDQPGEEDDQPGEEDITTDKDSLSFTQDRLPSTTPPLVGTFAEQTGRKPSPPSEVVTKTGPISSKGADTQPKPSAPLSIVKGSASTEHPSVQSTNPAAARLPPERPAHSAEDQAKLRKGAIIDDPPRLVKSKDPQASSLQHTPHQAALSTRSGRQSLAQSLMRQRDALIGEHVHKSRFSSTTASLERQFAKLRISETDTSQGTLPDTLEEPSSASNVASRRKGPTLPSFLQAIEKESDPGAAARRQYSGNLEPRTSTDPTEFKPETSRQQKPRSTSSSTADPLSFPTSRITPRTGEGPELPAFLRPGGLALGFQAATHAATSVPGRVSLKENQNPFARRPKNPNVSISDHPLASMASTNTSMSSTPPHLKSRRTKPSGPGIPSFLQEAIAAQKKEAK